MLQRAVASDPKSLESRITLGQLLLDEDRPTEAIQLFQAYDGARSSAIEILLANANIKMGLSMTRGLPWNECAPKSPT